MDMQNAISVIIFMSLLLNSCCSKSATTAEGNASLKRYTDSVIISEKDSTLLYMVDLPSTNEYGSSPTEIWFENKTSKVRRLIVRSNPECYGRIVTNNYYNPIYYKYPIDSIPSITKCIEEPRGRFIIVEGPTCDAGTIATFRIDMNTGDCYVFPSNSGFIGFSHWSDDVIVSSKHDDIDPDLALRYEIYYFIDTEGQIVNITDSKAYVIENALSYINWGAGLRVDSIKLLRHDKLVPRYNDDLFWGNKFKCKYAKFDKSIIHSLDSLADSDTKWTREVNGYCYHNVDFESGMFLTIKINKKNHTGVITRGAFKNPLNAPGDKNK